MTSHEHPITSYELARLNAIRMTIDQAITDPQWTTLNDHDRTVLVLGWLVCDPLGQIDPDDLAQAIETPTMIAVADQLLAEAAERAGRRRP